MSPTGDEGTGEETAERDEAELLRLGCPQVCWMRVRSLMRVEMPDDCSISVQI